jgi:molybdenum cofactor cytidylyltransferase
MNSNIGAIILAAGRSTRMGKAKLLLPWRESTVLDSVVQLALSANLNPIVVVTGAYQAEVHQRLTAYSGKVEEIYNPEFMRLEMFYSLKLGIAGLQDRCEGALIFLGDQPHIAPVVIEQIVKYFTECPAGIILPSYRMKRGHPFLLRRDHFQRILAMPDDGNLRTYIATHPDEIDTVDVETSTVIEDIDFPDDYEQIRKRHTQ